MTTVIHDEDFVLGPCNLYVYDKARASLTTAIGGESDLIFRARKAGVAGNSITIAYIVSGLSTLLSVVVSTLAIAVHLKTNGSGDSVSTAAEVRDAVNASLAAYALVYAVRASGSDGTGVVTALGAAPLTGGSETTTERFLGALSDETTVEISTAAVAMTAHLTGTQARDKRVTGGSFQIKSGLKEITLDNFASGFANAILIEGADGLRRLDFVVRTGESLRQMRGTKMQLRQVEGGVESADPEKILTVPECSPVDATVTLGYNVSAQRVQAVTYEAWPDSMGRLAFFGTEVL